MKYPQVVGARDTLAAVLAGKSLTRYGDGEFRLAQGGAQNVSQVNTPALEKELRTILITPQDFCLVGIPDLNPKLAKYNNWKKYEAPYARMLNRAMTYYSAFISRPDSDQTIDAPDFYEQFELLWKDKEVVLVRGSERSLVESRGPMASAKRTHTVLCARRDAYVEIDRVERDVIATGVQTVLLCAGAMATCLAYRLAKKGLHAIDAGHIAYLWQYYRTWKKSGVDPEIRTNQEDRGKFL